MSHAEVPGGHNLVGGRVVDSLSFGSGDSGLHYVSPDPEGETPKHELALASGYSLQP